MTDVKRVAQTARLRFGAMVSGLLVVGTFGYLGFSVVASGGFAGGLIALGAATGFAAFFSPCSFPLLVTFLAGRGEESAGQAAITSARVATGAAVLLVVVMGLVLIVGDAVANVIAFDTTAGRLFRASVGLTIVIVGLAQSGVIASRLGTFERIGSFFASLLPRGGARRWRGDFVYGFGYLLAGFG